MPGRQHGLAPIIYSESPPLERGAFTRLAGLSLINAELLLAESPLSCMY